MSQHLQNVEEKEIRDKLFMVEELIAIEKSIAKFILHKKQIMTKLVKLKDYATMKECNFRDEQIKKLVGE